MGTLFVVFQLIILVFSVIIHEVSHGFVAERLGDPTARLLGRLTLNPLKHIDPFGSVILPLLLSLVPGGFVFGWAKPVPYNPLNLKRPERDAALIAAAGPLSNLLIAVVFGVLVRLGAALNLPGVSGALFANLAALVVLVNVSLAVFNLIPIPPLDGSKVLAALLPRAASGAWMSLERYGFFILVCYIALGAPLVGSLVSWLFGVLTGI
jgi:Zn-dependent protease